MKRVRENRLARGAAPAAVLLTAGALWLFWPAAPAPKREQGGPSAAVASLPPVVSSPPVQIVPSSLAEALRAPTGDEAGDVAALRGLLGQLTTALRLAERPPLGDNADIAAALTGRNRRRLAFLASDHPALREGLLVDRGGAPYHFHARSADAIDVRSAGADGVLFTADDLVSRLGEP